MNKNKPTVRAQLFVRCVVGLIFCFVGIGIASARAEDPAPKRIGVVAPLTGSLAPLGIGVRNSILLAQREYDAAHEVQFVFEDDQYTPKNTLNSVRKLLDVDRVQGLIIFGTSTSLAVNEVAEHASIPMVALSISENVVEGKKFIMKHWVSSEVEHRLISQEVKRRGYKRVALIATTQDAMLDLRDRFVRSAPPKIVFNEEYPSFETDLRPAIARIAREKPDAVYVLLLPPQLAIFVRQLREAGYRGALFAAHQIEASEVNLARGAFIGAWFVTGEVGDDSSFARRYREIYGESPTNGGANAYDVARMMIEGVHTADLNHYLHQVKNFSGALGKYSATSKNDFALPGVIKEITAQGFTPISR